MTTLNIFGSIQIYIFNILENIKCSSYDYVYKNKKIDLLTNQTLWIDKNTKLFLGH
jgi:hypothetical protein